MSKVELYPFSHIVFFNEDVRSKYERLIEWADRATYIAEFELIKKGLRSCNFIHVDPMNPYSTEVIFKYGLYARVLQPIKRYSGFAHTHYTPTSIEDTLMFTAVCDNEENLNIFSNAYLRGDHEKIGELLGYPRCCIKHFVRFWGDHYDLVYPTAMNSKREGSKVFFDPRLNVMLRYVSLRIIPFFPHSFQCSNAIQFAEEVINILKSMNANMTKELINVLSKPLIFSQVNGIIQVDVLNENKEVEFVIIQSGYSDQEFKIEMVPEWVK